VNLGIMQGRLVPPEAGRFQSFPRQRWRDELPLAAAAGLDTIEWIYDAYGETVNPIATDDGLKELTLLSNRHRVKILSVCADWFMDFPLTVADAKENARRWSRLAWLVSRCGVLGVNRIVVPFVDSSAIKNEADRSTLLAGLRALTGVINETGIEIHLETDLAPTAFASLLDEIAHPRVKVNYDIGNSASLGYDPSDEFQAYGQYVGSVHIKDRRRGAGTVPLGTGDANFSAVVEGLRAVSYAGDFILQAARDAAGDELSWTRSNVDFARRILSALN
jgi:L-ribulose-5-phosphate 3-epimerase